MRLSTCSQLHSNSIDYIYKHSYVNAVTLQLCDKDGITTEKWYKNKHCVRVESHSYTFTQTYTEQRNWDFGKATQKHEQSHRQSLESSGRVQNTYAILLFFLVAQKRRKLVFFYFFFLTIWIRWFPGRKFCYCLKRKTQWIKKKCQILNHNW